MFKIFILTAIVCLIYFGQGSCRSSLESVADFPVQLTSERAFSSDTNYFKFSGFKNVTSRMINYLNGKMFMFKQ